MRTAEQMATDINIARVFEDEIAGELETLVSAVITNFNAKDKPDIELPSIDVFIELKLKNQPLALKWHKHVDSHVDTFVIDEVSVRKMVQFSPRVWFLLKDVPKRRMFVASVHELASVERVRLNRNNRGKLLFDLRHFRVVKDVPALLDQITDDINNEQFRRPWPLGLLPVAKV